MNAATTTNWESVPPRLKPKSGPVEFRMKNSMFNSWVTVHCKIEGRWLALYKKEGTAVRIGAIELGQGVQMKSMEDLDSFPRRFDMTCTGGALQAMEWNFRFTNRKDRDSWVKAILSNIKMFTAHDIEAFPQYREYETIVADMIQGVPTAMRLIPKSNTVARKSGNGAPAAKVPLHAKSFLGYDAVAFLIARKYAANQEQAETICSTLLSMNLIHHMVWAQDFSTNELFCFTQEQNADTCVQIFESLIEVGKFWIYLPIPIAVAVSFADSSAASMVSGGSISPRKESSSVTSISSLPPQSSSSMSGGSAPLTSRTISALSARHTSVHSRSPSSHSGSETSSRDPGTIEILDEGKWANPDLAKTCHCCEKGFNPLRRKHHCRLCGNVVCNSCGVHTTIGHVNRSVNVRVCIRCRLRMKQSLESSRYAGNGSDLASQPRLSITSNATNWTSASDPSSLATTSGSTAASKCSVCFDCDNKCQPLGPNDVAYVLDYSWGKSWPTPPRRADEATAVATLAQINVCGQPDPWFDQLCDVLVSNTGCEKAVIGFMDASHFVLMGTAGIGALDKAISYDVAFAPHALLAPEPLVCADVSEDIRFSQNAFMRLQWQVGFYASFPLQVSTGHIIGAVEVYDSNARRQCHNVQIHLDAVAQLVVQYLNDLLEQSKKGAGLPPMAPVATAAAPTPPPAASAATPAATAAPTAGLSSMEGTLMQLLEKTTGTQSQLQQQQAQMVHAVGNHSQQINMLAEKLSRIEAAIDQKAKQEKGGDE
ncbi:Aste57867_653 [Aphanomyces stellatus]|uniref:Aste57867_653 protein n=1 Tax=Aphanomyces stellatus TaxID=120398 RepID=A0A485K6E6_9STRA|nr:hypothetical protein As57867_000652 [Aphanomyces stellatus]VFT77878.1 Aste57867_653 [Aphanomyces stellatus]